MNHPICILHIVQCAGGVDRYLRMLLTYMDGSQFRHILVCSADYPREVYAPLVDAFEQVEMCNALSPKADAKAVSAVRRIVKKHHPDIIYCHSSKGGGIGRLACVGLGIPVVYNPHGWAFSMKGSRMKSLAYLCIERMLAPLTDRFVVISHYEKMTAVQHRVVRADRMKVIYNGIDFAAVAHETESAPLCRQSMGIPDDAYVVCMVGRISAQKAPDVFVRMAARIARQLPEAFFMIVGDGNERKEIEQMVAANGLSDKFLITGWQESPLPYVALADQAVLLSRWEGFGLVLAEYMLLGKPIVATEVNAIPELVVDYENGILVPCDDDARAAEAVMEIYNNESMRNKFIDNGLMRCRALFDARRMAMEHERLFGTMLNVVGR